MVEKILPSCNSLFPPPSPMRRLLVDAQAKFRRMVEENKGLPNRIEGEMQGIIGSSQSPGAGSTTASPSLPALPKRPNVPPPSIPNPSTPGSPSSGPGPPASSNATSTTASLANTSATTSTQESTHSLPPNPGSVSSPMHKVTMDKVAKDAEDSSSALNADGNSQGLTTSSTAGSLSPAASSTATNETKDMNAPDDDDRSKTSESEPKSFPEGEQGAMGEKDSAQPKSPSVTKLGENSFNRSWRRGELRSREGMDYYSEGRRIDRDRRGDRRDDGENRCCRRAREENERLRKEIATLRKLLGTEDDEEEGAVGGDVRGLGDEGEDGTMAPRHRKRLQVMEMELRHAKEAVAALKADRKRLKAEKFDLLNQMKQLYGTLEDKEKELRDFIRNYEQRMRENEASLQQLWSEREERERERWRLLRHAKDQTERGITLAAQLSAREAQARDLHQQLQECKRQLATVQGTCGCGASSDQECGNGSVHNCRLNGSGMIGIGLGGGITPTSGHPQTPTGSGSVLGVAISGERGSSADSGVRGSSDRESVATSAGGGNLSDSTTEGTPTITVEGSNMDVDSISVMSSIAPASHIYQTATTPKDSPSSLSPLNANSVFTRSVEQLMGTPPDFESRRHKASVVPSSMGVGTMRLGSAGVRSRGGSGGTWGSISRVFARNRHRKLASPSQEDVNDPNSCCRSWSPLTEEGYAEKLRLLREASSIPMERWRAPTVLAWLEIALGMPQYGPRCSENVKSGKVLLELSDVELEAGLGITHPLHRKKLRLAIEEHRRPALVRFPAIATLTHTWVSSEWLPDIGLAQFSESFATNMVDARMLDHLSKKELEKYLGVTRKFHQASIVHGIHLLRMMKYDRQALAVRRRQCENIDADPLVWTNQRIIRWAKNIDLGEYAENLKDSGVHGALIVLEPSFNGDTMANALGIPQSKNIIRRHLTAELEALVLPARAAFEHFVRSSKAELGAKLSSGGSLGRSFSRSNENRCPPPLPQRESFGLRLGLGGGLSKGEAMEGDGGIRGRDQKDQEMIREKDKDRRRASLRGSLSKALGLKAKQDLHANSRNYDIGEPTTSITYLDKRGSLVLPSPSPETAPSSSSSLSLVSPLPPPLPPHHPSSFNAASLSSQRLQRLHHHHHRRVKSIGDIETVTTVTPV